VSEQKNFFFRIFLETVKKMNLIAYVTLVFLIAVAALIISLYDLNQNQSIIVSGVSPVAPVGSTIALIATGDSLPVTETAGQIQITGQAGLRSYGLTSPSSTLTLRDLRNLSQYVVGPDATDSEYQTISSAVTAAVTRSNILVKQGSYDNEVIDFASVPQVLSAVGKNTAFLSNATITQSLNDVVIWQNMVFVDSVFNLTQGTMQFFNCVFENTTLTSNGNSPNFFDCQVVGGSVNITGGLALDFQRTEFGTSLTISNSLFNNGPSSCVFADITMNQVTSNFTFFVEFENCTFRLFGVLPNIMAATSSQCSFANCNFAITNIVYSGPFEASFDGCRFRSTTVQFIPNMNVTVVNCSFVDCTFSPFPTGLNIQISQSRIRTVNTLIFEGVENDFQTISFCNVTISTPAQPLFRIGTLGVAVLLRSYNCVFENDTFPVGTIFEFVDNAQLVLNNASIICPATNYATGIGTIIRPANGATQGTNFMRGPGNVAAGVTLTNAVAPWTFAGGYRTI